MRFFAASILSILTGFALLYGLYLALIFTALHMDLYVLGVVVAFLAVVALWNWSVNRILGEHHEE